MNIVSLSFSRGGSVVGWEILGVEVLARMIARGKLILRSVMLVVTHAILAICVSNRNSNACCYTFTPTWNVRNTHYSYPVILSQSARSSFSANVDWSGLIVSKRTPPCESAAPPPQSDVKVRLFCIHQIHHACLQTFPAVATVFFPSLVVPLSKCLLLPLNISITIARVSQRPCDVLSYQKLVKELC